MNEERLKKIADICQIVALLVAVLALIVQLVSLANPEWLIGVIGYPVQVSRVLLIIALVLWGGVTVIALVLGSADKTWPGGRGSLWSYIALTAVLGVAGGIWLSTKPPLSCEGYGIRIVSPKPGDEVQKVGSFIAGTDTTLPPMGI